MGLQVTPVSRCLDKKLQLFGFEMFDLIIVFLFLALLNLLFGQTNYKILLVWLPPILLSGVLRFGKKGKPEKYLLHLFRFQFLPGHYSAFLEPSNNPVPPMIEKGDANGTTR